MLQSPLFRRLYDVAALVALLNVLALTAAGGYFLAAGLIDGEKLRRAVSALRGEETVAPLVAQPPTPDKADENQPDQMPETIRSAEEVSISTPMDLEIMRREAERIKEELRQRLALNNSILLRVTTERETFQKERERAQKQEDARLAERRDGGFVKQVEIYEGLAPKLAAQHLLGIQEPEEAAKVLMAMDPRKARKIVEAAKRGDQMDRMMVILQRVREVAPGKSDELDQEEQ